MVIGWGREKIRRCHVSGIGWALHLSDHVLGQERLNELAECAGHCRGEASSFQTTIFLGVYGALYHEGGEELKRTENSLLIV